MTSGVSGAITVFGAGVAIRLPLSLFARCSMEPIGYDGFGAPLYPHQLDDDEVDA